MSLDGVRQEGAAVDDWFLHLHDYLWVKDEDTAKQEVALIRQALRLRHGSQVLDAPCCQGRIALPLARAGCHITGIDLNLRFLADARAAFQAEGQPGAFVAMDLRRLCFQQRFDAVYNWWASFGYFSDAENLQTLRGMAAALRPGGRLVIEQPNRQYVLRCYQPTGRIGDWMLRSHWNRRRQRMECTWILTHAGHEESYPMSMRWYTLGQFRHLFRRAGLTLDAAYGDYHGSPYRASSPRLIVAGERTE